MIFHILVSKLRDFQEKERENKEQAGAELCQAQD
jgi:hypothetical protein